jgi:hypothetical protein
VRRTAGGLSVSEAILTLLVLVFLTLGFLRLFSKSTTVPFAGNPSGASLSIEAALSSLARDIQNAGGGPLPSPVVPVADGVPAGYSLPLAGGRQVLVRPGTDVIGIRGILRHPVLVLDPVDRETGELFSARATDGPSGRLQGEPGKFRLRFYVYPLRLNPVRNWISGPGGAGMAWRDSGIRNESFESTVAILQSRREGRDVFFAVSDEEGLTIAGKVVSLDAASLTRDCDCRAPVPFPGECPPGRKGCFLEVTLDTTSVEARRLDDGHSDSVPHRLGRLASGGVAEEILYFIAKGEASDPDFLASARHVGDGYEMSHVADDIEDLQVAYGVADENGSFSPLVTPVASPVVGVPGKGGDQWWPNCLGEPLPAIEVLRTPSGGSRLRMVRVTVSARGGAGLPAEQMVRIERGPTP